MQNTDKKILVQIDGSECSLNAAKYAIKLAKDKMLSYLVSTLLQAYGIASILSGYSSTRESAILVQGSEGYDKKGKYCRAKTEIFTDVKSIVGSILDYATSKDIDLIVIGTKGRTGLKRFLMGSVANGVVQHAHCPVLLVR